MSKYAKLGIDASKKKVRKAFKGYIHNDFPGAFVNIVRDSQNPGRVFTQHMDGDGSKFLQRILIFLETGDVNVICGVVDDGLQMNLGDIAASGFVFGKIVVTDVININKANVPKDEIMEQIGRRFAELMEEYRAQGFNIYFLGGETADLPDQVNNAVFDVTVYAEAKESEIIAGNTQPDNKIWGFASDGQASWENEHNYGIMANGLTLGRIGLIWKGYTEKYPYLGRHEGRYKIGEYNGNFKEIPISHALISPTRQWAILIRLILEKLKEKNAYSMLHGITINTGGGATKIIHLGKNILYKKKMPLPSPIFHIIQQETGESWHDMFQTFNCGVGIDIVGEDNPVFKSVLREVSETTNVNLFDLGKCESYAGEENKVVLETTFGTFDDYR